MTIIAITFAMAAWACQTGANPLKLEIGIKPVMDTEISAATPDVDTTTEPYINTSGAPDTQATSSYRILPGGVSSPAPGVSHPAPGVSHPANGVSHPAGTN